MAEAKRFLVLDGDVVANVVLAAKAGDVVASAGQSVVPGDDRTGPGFVRQPDGSFADPAPQPQPQPRRQFSFIEFMDLFSEAEQRAIAGAAMTDVATKLWYDRAVGAQFINLDDERLVAGLDALVSNGLISSARRDNVLAGLTKGQP